MNEEAVKEVQDKPIRNHLLMTNKKTIAWFYKHQAKPFSQQRLENNEKTVDSVSSCWRFKW